MPDTLAVCEQNFAMPDPKSRRRSKTGPPTPDDIAAECIASRLRMLNRAVTQIYDEALRPLELKVSQMNILVATAKLDVARPADVCRHLHLDGSTLSRNVDRMKARGWIEVLSDDDGRAQPFRLTPAGRRLLARAAPRWADAQQLATELVGPEGAKFLRRATERLSAK